MPPETITFYYIFFNQHFYAYVNESGWRNHVIRNTILSDNLFKVYSVTVPY